MKRGVWIIVFLLCIGLVISLPPPPPPSPSIGGSDSGNSANLSENSSQPNTDINSSEDNINLDLPADPTAPGVVDTAANSPETATLPDTSGSNSSDSEKIFEMENSISELNTRVWIVTVVSLVLFLLLIFFIVLTKINSKNSINTNTINTSNNAGKTVAGTVTAKVVPEALRSYVLNMRSKGVSRPQLEQMIRQAGYDAETTSLVLKDY